MNRRPGDDRWPGNEEWPGDEEWPGESTDGDRQAAPTHRIVRRSDLGWDDDPKDDGPLGFRETVAEAVDQLRFVSQSPGSLRDQIEYARDGAYSSRIDGPWRTANIIYARFVAFPGLALCYLIGWALFTRLSRMLICGPLLLFLLMLLNRLPITQWLIPDGADFTTWLRG